MDTSQDCEQHREKMITVKSAMSRTRAPLVLDCADKSPLASMCLSFQHCYSPGHESRLFPHRGPGVGVCVCVFVGYCVLENGT